MGFPFAVSTVCLLSLTCAVMCSETYTISIHDRTIHCVKCPAGMYLVSNCSLDYGNAICESCGSGTYQPHPTTATSCALCRTECPYNTPQRTVQLVNGKCTMTSDIECLCVEGFYDDGGACRKWAECQPGEGVVTKGTSFSDTVCAICSEGTFSPNSSNSEQCIKCSVCEEGLETEDGSCNETSDTRCKIHRIPLSDNTVVPGLSSTSIALIITGTVIVLTVVIGSIVYFYRKTYCRTPVDQHISKGTLRNWTPWESAISTSQPANVTGRFINIVGPFKAVDSILDLKIITTAAESVGLISVGNNLYATCFRVGTKYIMTASHVVETILRIDGFPAAFRQTYVVFSYTETNRPIEEHSKYFLKEVYSEDGIPFNDRDLDCAVLELRTDADTALPDCLEIAWVPLSTRFSLITQRAEAGYTKSRDKVDFFIDPSATITEDNVNFLIDESRRFLKEYCLTDIAETVFEDKQQIQNPNRLLLNCCSSHGASGSPGVSTVRGKPYAVTMLLHGYPNWYYNPHCDPFIRGKWKQEYTVEQGANFEKVADKMNSVNPMLHQDIFRVNRVKINV